MMQQPKGDEAQLAALKADCSLVPACVQHMP